MGAGLQHRNQGMEENLHPSRPPRTSSQGQKIQAAQVRTHPTPSPGPESPERARDNAGAQRAHDDVREEKEEARAGAVAAFQAAVEGEEEEGDGGGEEKVRAESRPQQCAAG